LCLYGFGKWKKRAGRTKPVRFFYESGGKCELLSAKGLTSAAFVIS